jgi:hypothetical protein
MKLKKHQQMKWLKIRLIYWLTKHLLPVFDDKDIISFVKGSVFVDGGKLTDQEIRNLQAETKFFEDSMLWKLMNTYPTKLAKKKIFNDSKDITDLIFGKTVLYTLEIQKNIKDNLKNTKV